jgi:hypothetical protein
MTLDETLLGVSADHRDGVLATIKANGRPQLSTGRELRQVHFPRVRAIALKAGFELTAVTRKLSQRRRQG